MKYYLKKFSILLLKKKKINPYFKTNYFKIKMIKLYYFISSSWRSWSAANHQNANDSNPTKNNDDADGWEFVPGSVSEILKKKTLPGTLKTNKTQIITLITFVILAALFSYIFSSN